MNTDNNIDELFRNGLGGGEKEPPSGLWDSISASLQGREVPGNGVKRSKKAAWWWWGGSGIVLLAALALLLVPSLPETPVAISPENTPARLSHHPAETNPTAAPSAPVALTSAQNKIQQQAQRIPVSMLSAASNHPVITGELIQKPPVADNPYLTTIPEQHHVSEEITTDQLIEEFYITERQEIAGTSTGAEATVSADTGATPADPLPALTSGQDRPGRSSITKTQGIEPLLGLTLQVAPQFYKPLREYQANPAMGFEGVVMGHTNIRKIRISAGVGYACGAEKNRWKATILRLDTVAVYPDVTSVQFLPVYNPVDSTISGYIPAKITTVNHPVIDTVAEEVYRDLKNRYHYVQVPVLLGYDFWGTKSLSLGISAGVIYNYQIYKTLPIPSFPAETLLFSLNGTALTRKESWWQYQAGVTMRYDLGGKWFAEGSVAFRRPFSGWYREAGTEHRPNTILAGAGIGIWL